MTADIPYTTQDADDFWLRAVASIGSNSATDAFSTLEVLVASGRIDEPGLRRLSSALRSLMDRANDRRSEMEARRKRPWEFAA